MQLNWGIHPTKAYAIPFLAKDKPSLKSTFSSIILTFFLTLYYYYNYYGSSLDIPPLIVDFIIQTKLYKKFTGYEYLDISVEQVKQIYQEHKDEIIEYIISTIEITEEQMKEYADGVGGQAVANLVFTFMYLDIGRPNMFIDSRSWPSTTSTKARSCCCLGHFGSLGRRLLQRPAPQRQGRRRQAPLPSCWS